MAECLKIYSYVTGVDDPYFHDTENPILITSFTYTANRMGSVQLTASFYHKDQLDDYWDGKQYVIFRGEKYYVKQVPSSTKDTSSDRYKYDVTFKSERSILDGVYFFDVVTDETENDRYQSNNTDVVFFGNVHEFAKRLNYSLQYSGLDYTVVVDDDVTSESKYVQFEDKFISDVLEEFYNTYNVPYYFDGKTIHIGYTNNAIAIPFAYGANRELLSVAKTNANYRIVNRCTGVGSSDNIPFYYPNETEKGVVEVVCPESNTGISTSDVVVLNSNMLGNSLSLADKLEYKNFIKSGIVDILSIKDNVTGSNFENGAPLYKDLTLDGNYWGVSQNEIIIEFNATIEKGNSAYISINTKYKLPEAYVRIQGQFSPSDFTLNASERFELSSDGGNVYSPVGKTFQIDKAGTYYLKMNVSFRGVADSIYGKPYQVSNYSIFVELGKEYEYNAWTLNGGDEVSLGAYGIKINEGVTPNVGDVIGIGVSGDFIRTTGKLMPSIYRETNGAERFYNALNNTYPDGEGGYLHFDNEYTDTDPKEQIVEFSDIKPTIAGITNASGVRIDQIADIAFDDDDSDEVDEDGEYLHPYFYVKLNKFDGEWGFNLFNMAIVGDTNMTLSLTSGNCSAASFEIAVVETDDGRFLNPVQVDENGDIVPGGLDDKVKTSNIQDRQQDTSANSVWIALRKDDSTFGVIIPNATNNYKPSAGDNFVLLYIDLPEAYKRAAEKRLDDAIIKYMLENNNSKFNFSLQFSRIFFAENPDILAQVNENARIILEYDNKEYTLYISTYTYTVSDDEDLPEISVDLKDTITVVKGTIEQMVDSVVGDTVSSMGLGETKDTLAANTRYFLRKDVQDVAKKRITFLEGATFGNFADMIGGATMDIDPVTGQSLLTVDKLKVRLKAYFDELTVVRANSIGGKHIVTPAGSILCTRVEDLGSAYRCYFANSQDGVNVANMFMTGDLAISESFNVMSGISDSGVTNNYYWREVVGVGPDYVELSKTKCDADSDIPKEGDVICQLGNISDVSRQGAIVLSSVGVDAPSVTLYSGINTYSYAGKDYIRFGVNGSTNEPFMAVYGNMFFGDRDLSDPDATFITFQQKEGEDRKRLHIKADVTFGAGSEGLSNLSEWQGLADDVSNAQESANNAQSAADNALSAASNAEGTANDALSAAEEAARKAQEAKDYIDNALPDEIENINKKLDGVVENWFYPYSPTLENEPAASWVLNGEEAKHEGDTFTNTQAYVDDETTPDSGKSWRWVKSESGSYEWTIMADSDAVKALQQAAKAQDTADGKRRIFVVEPTTPYDVGDMWSQGPAGDLMRCIKSRGSGAFDASDWDLASKYTDDTVANSVKDRLDGWASDGVVSPPEKTLLSGMELEIRAEYNTIIDKASKYGVEYASYQSAYQLAILAFDKYTASTPELIEIESDYGNISKYYSARESILRKINDAEASAISDLNYLKTVFPNNVVDNNGVFLSQLMAVKNSTESDAVVVAGMYGGGVDALNNAGFKDPEHGILMWFAGADNVQSVASARTRVYSDGSLFTDHLFAEGGKIGGFTIGDIWLENTFESEGVSSATYLSGASIQLRNTKGDDRVDFAVMAYPSIGNMDPFAAAYISNVYKGSDTSRSTVALQLSASGSNAGSSGILGGDPKGSFAIYALKGAFAGLRPAVRQITGSVTLSAMDHTIVVTAQVPSITIMLVANPENGQQYYIYKSNESTISISGNGKNITRAGISTQSTQTLAYNSFGMAILIYSSEVREWVMSFVNS